MEELYERELTIQDILEDGLEFISRLRILDKFGQVIQLVPTSEQIHMFKALESGKDCLFVKPRQIGSTTFVAAYLFWKWYTATDPTAIYILSHKLDSSKHILTMFKRFFDYLPAPLQRELEVKNTTEMRLDDTKAKICAVSAEGKGGLRSFSCNYLLMSEFAFSPNPDELKATAISALNGNQLVIESTANHFGDALHQEVLKYERDEGHWNMLFFPWYQHSDYSTEPPTGWECSDTAYQDTYELTDAQMYWRENKIAQINKHKFQREYPATTDEAFAQGGNAYFEDEDLAHVEVVHLDKSNKPIIIQNVDFEDAYALAADVASGRGGDYSTIHVFSKKTYTPVAIFRSNTIAPIPFAEMIVSLATRFNRAKVLVEENNWGLPVLQHIRAMGYTNLWVGEDGKDWNTNVSTKRLMFEELRAVLSDGYITMLDQITVTELKSFQVDARGLAPKVPNNLEHHGDMVIALALVIQCLKKVKISTSVYLPEFIKKRRVDKIIKSQLGMHGRRY